MEASSCFKRQYQIKAYFVYGAAMYIFFYRLISNSMLSQMNRPLFLFPETETFYQFFLRSGIPQFITSSTVISAVFDVSLLITTVGFLLSFNRIFSVAFWFLVLNYFLTYNLVTGHHYHGLIGMLVITLTFWFKDEKKFGLAWDAARYYFLYIFVSAALWKIFRGSAFYADQMSNILKSQQIELLLQNPASFHARAISFFIAHPPASHFILLVNVVVQASFVVGFFTKRFDSILLALAVLFCIANFFVMSILSVELLILGLTLLDWEKVESYLVKKEIVTT